MMTGRRPITLGKPSLLYNNIIPRNFQLNPGPYSIRWRFTLVDSYLTKTMCKNLADVSLELVREFFDQNHHVLCDNDGVLTNSGIPFPTVQEFYETLRKLKKSVNIITNNAIFPKTHISDLLMANGFLCGKREIISSIDVAINYLKQRNFKEKIIVIGHDNVMKEFGDAGFNISSIQPEFLEDVTKPSLAKMLEIDPSVKAVYFDVNFNVTYNFLAKVIRHLENPNVLYLLGATDRLVPFRGNLCVVGPDPFQKLVSKASKREPIVLGKPGLEYGKYITEVLKYKPAETIIIGDSLDQDISFAKKLGFKSILTLSGGTVLEDLKRSDNNSVPDYYVEDIAALATILQKAYKI